MKYKCKKFFPGVTVGAIYTEYMLNPNTFNACVVNDDGDVQYIPRNEYFDLIDEHRK